MTPEEEKHIQGQGGQTATGTVRDAGRTLVRNNPLDETTPPPSERDDTAAAPATAQQGGDAASGKSKRRKELERKIGVELATYGEDQGGEQGTTRGGDMRTTGTTDNTYMKASRSTTRQVYDHTVPEARRLAFADADEMDRHLRDKGLTLGEIIMKHYPKPAYQEDEEKALKRRRTAALLSDSFKLVSDIAAGAYGGNIYQRDNSKAYSDIDNKLQKLKDDYKRDYDKWLQAQLAARVKDRDTYLGNYRDFFDAYRTPYTVSESETNRTIYEDNKKAQEDSAKEKARQFDEEMAYKWAALNAEKSANGQDNRKMVAFYNPLTGQPVYVENDNHTADMLADRLVNKIREEKYMIPSVAEALTYLGKDVKTEDLIKKDEDGNETVDTAKLNMLYKSLTPEDKLSFVNMMIDRSPQATKALLEAMGYDLEQDNVKSWFNDTFGITSPFWVSDGKMRITVPNGEYEDFLVPNNLQGFEQVQDTTLARQARNPKYRSGKDTDNPVKWGERNSAMIEDFLKRNAPQDGTQNNGGLRHLQLTDQDGNTVQSQGKWNL